MTRLFGREVRLLKVSFKRVRRRSIVEHLRAIGNAKFFTLACYITPFVLLAGSIFGVFAALAGAAVMPEPEVETLLRDAPASKALAQLVFIGPAIETAIFHFTPLALTVCATRKLKDPARRRVEWAAVIVSIIVFSGVHGWNATQFSMVSVIARVPGGIFFSLVAYSILRFFKGEFESRLIRAFCMVALIHATHNFHGLAMTRWI